LRLLSQNLVTRTRHSVLSNTAQFPS